MRKLSSLKYRGVHIMLTQLYLLALMSTILGSLNIVSEVICEFEDANLIWRNIQTYEVGDIKAMTWYKGKGSLIATWLEGKGFFEYPPYIGRLMQIGETGVKIKNAKRSDSGTYWLSLTLASSDHMPEAETHLEVKAAPSRECKPRITRAGSILMAELPAEGCGTPSLTLRWKHKERTANQKNTSRLDLGANPEPGDYMVCAEGESAMCYQGNISDLCTKYTIFQSDNLQTRVILPSVLVPVLIFILVAVVIWYKHGVIRKRCRRKENTINENEIISFKGKNTEVNIGTILLEVQDYLKKMYDSLTNIPLSPFDDETSVSISELYINILLGKVEFTSVDNREECASSSIPCDQQPLISNKNANQSNQFRPIFIFGECGSGKTTWCKHLVNCWLQKADNSDANVQGLNLPDIKNIQILLYLPMKFSDKDLSFEELLKKYIFKENSRYLEFVMNFVEDNAQNVLIIMDGIDITRESSKPISGLLHDKFVSSCTVIVTSRPSSLKLLYDTCQDKIKQLIFYRIREMDIEDSKIYVTSLLGSINRLHGKNLVFKYFWDFVEQLQVQSLLKVPYMSILIVYMWMINKENVIEITDILFEVTHQYIRRVLSDKERNYFIEKTLDIKFMDIHKCITKLNRWPLLIEHSNLLCVLSRVAATMFTSKIETHNKQVMLSKECSDQDSLYIDVVCETGLLTESLSLSANKNVSNLAFSDKIICEFFVSIFTVLEEGKECDFIVDSGRSCLRNSMIIYMIFQLSNRVAKDIMVKASKNLKPKFTDGRSSDRSGDSSNKIKYSLTEGNFVLTNRIFWLEYLMYQEELHQNQLLFLTTSLHFIDSLISVYLENQENDAKLVFWLPFLTTVETLILNINGCTLLLCKEWYDKTQSTLREVVIQSVYISIATLELLVRSLRTCKQLKKLEISPAECVAENNFFPQTSDLARFSWMQLSEIIADYKKLNYLKLSNLSLVGEVDIVVSNLNHYTKLKALELMNLSNGVQKSTSALHLPYYPRFNDNESKLPDKINLNILSLEKLTLLHSPINFMLRKTKKGETNVCKNNLQILRILEVVMPRKSWEKLGNQLGLLKLSVVHLQNVCPRDSAQIILDGIGKCEELKHLSVVNLDTRESSPFFTFLKNLKELSKLQIENINFSGSSAWPLFEGIRECQKLKSLSFCNISIGSLPKKVSFDLHDLYELTVDTVKITNKSDSLYRLLDAFKSCNNLETLSLTNVMPEDVPPVLSNRKTLKINMIKVQNNV